MVKNGEIWDIYYIYSRVDTMCWQIRWGGCGGKRQFMAPWFGVSMKEVGNWAGGDLGWKLSPVLVRRSLRCLFNN